MQVYLQKYEASIHGRAERNGAKTAVESLVKRAAEAIQESREQNADFVICPPEHGEL